MHSQLTLRPSDIPLKNLYNLLQSITVPAEKARFTNWGRTFTCVPSAIFEPENEFQCELVLELARREGKTLRVAGVGHSPNDLACTNQYMLRTTKLNRVLEVANLGPLCSGALTLTYLSLSLGQYRETLCCCSGGYHSPRSSCSAGHEQPCDDERGFYIRTNLGRRHNNSNSWFRHRLWCTFNSSQSAILAFGRWHSSVLFADRTIRPVPSVDLRVRRNWYHPRHSIGRRTHLSLEGSTKILILRRGCPEF